MTYLLDSGILIRLMHPTDPQHVAIEQAIAVLRGRGISFACGIQNVAEFWNVSTRPLIARGGFGLTLTEVERRLVAIERSVRVIPESDASYAEWKQLVVRHAVSGVQVHDTRLVALMTVNGIGNLLTLNPTDFKRFPAVVAVTPQDVVSAGQQP